LLLYLISHLRCRESQDIVDEIDLNSKAKEAELNAKVLSMESQVHWLSEQNKGLIASAKQPAPAPAPATTAELDEMKQKHQSLEQELRRAKRAEQKMQALLFRLRKDVEEKGSDLGSLLSSLQDVRSLQYDVDLLTQKIKRYEKLAAAQSQEPGKGVMQALNGPRQPLAAAAGPLSQAKIPLVAHKAGAAIMDKENAPLL
jgi:centromeric protein E